MRQYEKGDCSEVQPSSPGTVYMETQLPNKINTWNIWLKALLWPWPRLPLQRTHIWRIPPQRLDGGRGDSAMRPLKGRRVPVANTPGPEQQPCPVLSPKGRKTAQHDAGVAITDKKILTEHSLSARKTQAPGGTARTPGPPTILHDLFSLSTTPPRPFPRVSLRHSASP